MKTALLESLKYKITAINSQPVNLLKEKLLHQCFLGKLLKMDCPGWLLLISSYAGSTGIP